MALSGSLPQINLGVQADCGSLVVKVSDVMSSSPVPLKTRHVGQRCTLNLSRAEPSSRRGGVVARSWECQLRCRPRHLTMVKITWSVAKNLRVAEQCIVNIHSLTIRTTLLARGGTCPVGI
ncbi:hypothetical protein TNCV_1662651 [Trichonephila clavipes]|nr:hypothetical protein TNCV_1662651 [Trichonephila clavipes]